MGGKIKISALRFNVDSNVGEYISTQNFFELDFNPEKLSISFRDSLNQELLLFFDVYQQNLNIPWDLETISAILNQKIHISSRSYSPLLVTSRKNQLLSQSSIVPILYGCPMGLQLASQLQISRETVVKKLAELFALKAARSGFKSNPKLLIEITVSGWLNCWLNPLAIDIWQQKMVHQIKTPVARESTLESRFDFNKQDWDDKASKSLSTYLLSMQYLHARCCSLLRLGAEAKLIKLLDFECWHLKPWPIKSPTSASWLDTQGKFQLNSLAECNLLRQLFLLTDNWQTSLKRSNWLKMAWQMCLALQEWYRNCQMVSAVAQKNPQQAIARLYLVAIARYWLKRTLEEKIGAVAPQAM